MKEWSNRRRAWEEGGCRYLLLYCPMVSVIYRDKYVSWSLCLQMFSYLIISLALPLPHSHYPPVILSHSPRHSHQALSDFCSDPNAFVLNSTQFNSGTSSGTDSLSEQRFLENLVVFHACHALDLPPAPNVLLLAESNIMTDDCFHIFSYCALIFCALLFCWPPRRVGLLPDLQQAHEQSIPAGNATSASQRITFAGICWFSYPECFKGSEQIVSQSFWRAVGGEKNWGQDAQLLLHVLSLNDLVPRQVATLSAY